MDFIKFGAKLGDTVRTRDSRTALICYCSALSYISNCSLLNSGSMYQTVFHLKFRAFSYMYVSSHVNIACHGFPCAEVHSEQWSATIWDLTAHSGL